MLNKFMKNCTVAVLGTTMLFSASAFASDNSTVGATPVLPGNLVEEGVSQGFHIQDSQANTVRVYGSLTKLENGQIKLQNDNENDPYKEIVLNLSENTIILDAVEGTPVNAKDLKEGEVVYAYTGKAMTRSLPPISNAELILCNIPADYGVPNYFEIQSVLSKTEDGTITVSTDGDTLLTVNKDTTLFPYLTKNIVTTNDLVPGTKVLAWYDAVTLSLPAQAAPTKMMVFPYEYTGYVEVGTDGSLYANGDEKIALDKNTEVYSEENEIMLPLRKIAEAMGYSIGWDNATKAVTVTNSEGKVLVEFVTGSNADAPSTEALTILSSELKNGTTYVSADTMESFLNIAISQKN